MPTIFSHAIFATVAGKACASEPKPARFWALTALCAVLPDADVIAFAYGYRSGSMLGHRGFTHSICFALLVGLLIGTLAFRKTRTGYSTAGLVLYFTLATLSHPLLDALTDGGSGVALLAPFSSERYFLPWRPIEVSPIGMRFFGPRGAEVIISEIKWVWLPAFALFVVMWLFRASVGKVKKHEKAKR